MQSEHCLNPFGRKWTLWRPIRCWLPICLAPCGGMSFLHTYFPWRVFACSFPAVLGHNSFLIEHTSHCADERNGWGGHCGRGCRASEAETRQWNRLVGGERWMDASTASSHGMEWGGLTRLCSTIAASLL